jgi:hypothetical protein
VPYGLPCLMPISTPLQPSHPSFSKMEDRKRSAGDDLAPPTKRQAINGKASADSDLPWAGEIEVCLCRRYSTSNPFSQIENSLILSSFNVYMDLDLYTTCILRCMIYRSSANTQPAVHSMLHRLQICCHQHRTTSSSSPSHTRFLISMIVRLHSGILC